MKKFLKGAKWLLISILLIVLIILIPIGINKTYESIRASTLSEKQKYSEDLERLEYIMKNEFAGYGVLPGTSLFDTKLSQLKGAVGSGSVNSQTSFILSVIKTVAAFKDPHTSVFNDNILLDSRFPYYLEWSDDTFYLMSGQVDKKWLGAEVTKIGNTPSKEVFNKLSTYTNSPNEAGTAFFIRSFLYSADVLYEEGIIQNRDKVDIEVTLNGETSTLTFNSMSRSEFAALPDYHRLSEQFKENELPLYMTNREKNYWYQYIQEQDLFYLRYSLCVAQGDIETFWDEVFDNLKETNPDKLVIDVRGNPGGDTQNHNSFLNRLQRDTQVNRYGKLFTLIDRGTGSAAVAFASDMEKMTESILAGEKTMDKPNTTSDPTFFTLPHSGVTVLVPSLYSFHSYVNDSRDAVTPSIPVTQKLNGNSYVRDEVMDSVSRINIKNSDLISAQLPASMEGQYRFSTIRNASISKRDSIWYLSVDGLIDAPIYQHDSLLLTLKYNGTITQIDSIGKSLMLTFHGRNFQLDRVDESDISLEKSIIERKYDVAERTLSNLVQNGELPHYLDRPYFQTRVYNIYNQHGFEEAIELNKLTKRFHPNDPVASIVDFELYQYEGKTFEQINAVFPVIGKLLNRYFTVVTTDKVMNDKYNAFIGR